MQKLFPYFIFALCSLALISCEKADKIVNDSPDLIYGATEEISVGNDKFSFKASDSAKAKDFTKLVWSDEFEGTKLKSDNWDYETGESGFGNNEKQTYTKNNLEVTGGTLHITADQELNSARITTSELKKFQYGKIEARMLFSKGNGSWPAFWLLGQNLSDGYEWPRCGEIDIMEHKNSEKQIYSTLHWNSKGSSKDAPYAPADYGKGSLADLDEINVSEWHTYFCIWTSKQISFGVDDITFVSIPIGDSSNGTDCFNNPFFIIFNFAMGGDFVNVKDTKKFTKLPWEMYVDYVRVYQDDSAVIE